MNTRFSNIIGDFFTAYKDDYVISINGDENVSYIVSHNRVSFKKYGSNFWTIVKVDEMAEIITSPTKLTILTNYHQQYRFIARQKTNEEKVNELVEAITNRLAGREELNMIKEYLDELKKVNKVRGKN
ncbi:MAG: hypothetical protein IJ341_12880 [Bacteroidales bacterium]|nr:hypothetical protein [Bacteroidales bacterium]